MRRKMLRVFMDRVLRRIKNWAMERRGPTCVFCDRSVFDDGGSNKGMCHALHPLRGRW